MRGKAMKSQLMAVLGFAALLAGPAQAASQMSGGEEGIRVKTTCG